MFCSAVEEEVLGQCCVQSCRWRSTDLFLVRLVQGSVGLTLQGRDGGEQEWLGRLKQGLKFICFLLFTCEVH